MKLIDKQQELCQKIISLLSQKIKIYVTWRQTKRRHGRKSKITLHRSCIYHIPKALLQELLQPDQEDKDYFADQ